MVARFPRKAFQVTESLVFSTTVLVCSSYLIVPFLLFYYYFFSITFSIAYVLCISFRTLEAGGSEKKREKNNAAEVQMFSLLAFVGIPVHVLIRIWYFGDSMSYYAWVGSFVSMAAVFLSWWILRSSAAKGADLMMKDGMLEYFKDMAWIGFASMIGAIFSDWFFLLLLVVPAYAMWQAGAKLLAYLMPPPDAAPDAATLKRMAKKERQAEQQARRSKGK